MSSLKNRFKNFTNQLKQPFLEPHLKIKSSNLNSNSQNRENSLIYFSCKVLKINDNKFTMDSFSAKLLAFFRWVKTDLKNKNDFNLKQSKG